MRDANAGRVLEQQLFVIGIRQRAVLGDPKGGDGGARFVEARPNKSPRNVPQQWMLDEQAANLAQIPSSLQNHCALEATDLIRGQRARVLFQSRKRLVCVRRKARIVTRSGLWQLLATRPFLGDVWLELFVEADYELSRTVVEGHTAVVVEA